MLCLLLVVIDWYLIQIKNVFKFSIITNIIPKTETSHLWLNTRNELQIISIALSRELLNKILKKNDMFGRI